MKYPCNLIRDILPLYHDQVASEESSNIVREHLCECSKCREYYERMCESDVVEPVAYDEQMEMQTADSYKKVHKKIIKKIGKMTFVAVLAILGGIIGVCGLFVGYFMYTAETSKEVHTDVSDYHFYRSGTRALEKYHTRPMDESIWPEKITDSMEVEDYLMAYYNPWDANYLGYLVVDYNKADYEAEVARLTEYSSSEYIGTYGVTGFAQYEVLAIIASDYGFVYALTDSEDTIIYVEILFAGHYMAIEYEDYVPEEYLPEGLDVSEDNPTRQAWRAYIGTDN